MENKKIREIRLIVAGTRTFDDYALMREKLDQIILGLREDHSGALDDVKFFLDGIDTGGQCGK